MRIRVIVVSVCLTCVSTTFAFAAPPAPYYLALGDSLAIGWQPTGFGTGAPSDQGYVDQLYAQLQQQDANLRLQKLGCSGETTTTMIEGGICSYPRGSQLAQAVAFLRTHRVALVTLNIGGDNILHCISLAGVDRRCVLEGIIAAAVGLLRI